MEFFNKRYEKELLTGFFKDKFLPEDYQSCEEDVELTFNSKYIQRCTRLGKCKLQESHTLKEKNQKWELTVYEICHDSPNDPRVSLTKDTFRLMKKYGDNHVLALYTSRNSRNYRLSYVTLGLIAKGTKIDYEHSNPRRYSYFLGPDAKVQTPNQYLKGRVESLDDLKNRFSVEVVNKEFYHEISCLFTQLVGGTRKCGKETKEFQALLELPSTNNHKQMQEFAVRMIGRIVFCWFLKKKAVPDGQPLIPDDVLSFKAVENAVKNDKNYYRSVLEKLFFQVLNTPQEQRREEFQTGLFAGIPFLNGGLFEPRKDSDFYELDKFTEIPKCPNSLKVPNHWMKEFFILLETYNFTIDENTSMDVELSVDPEMLGRIFENLLAEINPQTGETARKSTGSYYTPRSIVEYMVDGSLKQYLKTKTQIDEKKLDTLLSFSQEIDETNGEEGITEEEKNKIIDALDQAKIIDPACGSGAFPMGVLQKLVLILEKIDPGSERWLEKRLEKVPPELRQYLRKNLKKETVNYIHKEGLIRSAIYGVDIQEIAVEISKLRVFLSLIVDTRVEESKPGNNRGIKPLPNLEFKFVCADSLNRLYKNRETFGRLLEDRDGIEKLKTLRNLYFDSYAHDKEKIKKEFKESQNQMAGFGEETMFLSIWNPFGHSSSCWFESDLMFGVTDGFDIVISNPPYIQLSKNLSQGQKDRLLSEYSSAMGRFNAFGFFIAKGIKLMNSQGCLTYIIPNTILTQEYYQELRSIILKDYTIDQIWEIDKMPFDDAVVENIILILSKGKDSANVIIKKISGKKLSSIKIIPQKWFEQTYLNSFNVNLNHQLINFQSKMQEGNLKLGDIVEINQAIAIKKDCSKFLFQEKMGDEYKPVLEGRDIGRYGIKWPGTYLKYDISAIHSCKSQDIFLSNEKIFFRRVGDRLVAAYDDHQYFALNTLVVINLKPRFYNYNLKYILGLFNSRLFNYYYKKILKSTKKVFSEIQANQIAQMPVKNANEKEREIIIDLVDKILSLKAYDFDADTNSLEIEIDQLFYQLYGLTENEVDIIERTLGSKFKEEENNYET
ncbi:MAG: Eco57I restriction-modification methylase domain-containing protein [Candidatus Omnitrophota bacterium]